MKSLKVGIAALLIALSSAFALSGRRESVSNEPVDNLKGKIVQVDRSMVVLRDNQAIPHTFRFNEETTCVIDGREAPMTQLAVGYNCLLTSLDGKVATAITAFNSKVGQEK